MGKLDSEYLTNANMKDLEIVLDEGDDILKCIKIAMKQNNISKADIIEMTGKIKEFTVNYFIRTNLKAVDIEEPKEIFKADGEFKYEFARDHMFGRIRLLYNDQGKTFEGRLQKGKAVQDLKLVLRYMES